MQSIKKNLNNKNEDFLNDFSWEIIKPEKMFFIVTIIYGCVIGLLTLAVPIAIQTLLNTVVNTNLVDFIFNLSLILFFLLFISILLILCRDYTMEIFQRRFLARITSRIALQLTHADLNQMSHINPTELVNRFFEIMHVQKNMPSLLTEGFFIILQTFVGLVVVSFYHPHFFIFNILFFIFLLASFILFARHAFLKRIAVSDAKYHIAEWLQEIARVNKSFKSKNAIDYSLEKTNAYTHEYMSQQKSYFHTTFTQHICFLVLYCISSASFLWLGAILVSKNELTIGQLIGSELIMSAIFYNISKFGHYSNLFYQLKVSLYKINYFFNLPLENFLGNKILNDESSNFLFFDKLEIVHFGQSYLFDFKIEKNSSVLIRPKESHISNLFIDLIRCFRQPSKGNLLLNDQDIFEYDPHMLRNEIIAVDSKSVVEGTIQNLFLRLCPNISKSQILICIKNFGLDDLIDSLPMGLNTHIFPSGYPLSQNEILILKLSIAFAAKPKILVLTEIYDVIPNKVIENILRFFCEQKKITFIYFTQSKQPNFFEHYFLMEKEETKKFKSIRELYDFENKNIAERFT